MKRFIVSNDRKIYDGDNVYYLNSHNEKMFGKLKLIYISSTETKVFLVYDTKRKKYITDISKIHPTQFLINF